MKDKILSRLKALESKQPQAIPDSETILEVLPAFGEEPEEIPYVCLGYRNSVFYWEDKVRQTTPEDIHGWQAIWGRKATHSGMNES